MSSERPMPLPHRDDRGEETGQHVYPTFARRVANLIDALNALERPDPNGIEGPYYARAEGGVIGLYSIEGEKDDDPHHNLEGWLVPDGDVGWSLITRKPQWSEGTASDAAAVSS
jgi:hypothetical protein